MANSSDDSARPTVLLVEDEPDLRLVVETLLDLDGYRVIGVGTGEEALERIDEADVILLDIRLPGMSGRDVVRTLSPEIRSKVVFMSALADLARTEEIVADGCAGFLVKPFNFQEMRAQLAKVISST